MKQPPTKKQKVAAAAGRNGAGDPEISDAEIEKRKLQGFLLCSSQKPPKLNHAFTKAGGKAVCNGSLFQKRFCGKKNCHKYHVPLRWCALPPADRAKLTEWVNNTPDVTFAPNAGNNAGEC